MADVLKRIIKSSSSAGIQDFIKRAISTSYWEVIEEIENDVFYLELNMNSPGLKDLDEIIAVHERIMKLFDSEWRSNMDFFYVEYKEALEEVEKIVLREMKDS